LVQDGKHLVTVFERAKGVLVSELLGLDTQEAFKIVNGAVRFLIDLEENKLNHGDIRAWNVMYDKATSQVSLIDLDQGNQQAAFCGF
jgi:RIO-like serine/threonine protein kinase